LVKRRSRSLALAAGVLVPLTLLAAGCAPATGIAAAGAEPLWEAGDERHKIVVISDLHLGVEDEVTEMLANRPLLVDFLTRLQGTGDVRELVIAGDFLDEWYLPVWYPAVTDHDAFYREVIANNQDVIDELNRVADSGISLVYVPGNHDMTLAADVLQEAIPSLRQERDVDGLGVYRTGDRGEIVIEHGHRYDVFSAPDTVTNAALCDGGGAIYPSGYLYARYAATWVLEGKPEVVKDLPVVATAPDPSDVDQYGAYLYYSALSAVTAEITPTEAPDAPIFDVRLGGLCGAYSFLDYYPAVQADGTISAPVLFRDVQRTWAQRQAHNEVAVPSSFVDAVTGALDWRYFLEQARLQHLERPGDGAEIVVFGHTHVPTRQAVGDGAQYVNSGTWVDDNTAYPAATRTFAVLTTGESSSAALYRYGEDGALTDLGEGASR